MRSIFFLFTVVATLTWSASARAVAPVGIGDMDGDGAVSLDDVGAIELALTQPQQYLLQYTNIPDWQTRGDINQDGVFDNFDLQPFVEVLSDATTGQIPEPSSVVLAGLGAVGLVVLRKKVRRRHAVAAAADSVNVQA